LDLERSGPGSHNGVMNARVRGMALAAAAVRNDFVPREDAKRSLLSPDRPGAIMKRLFLFAGVVILGTTWSSVVHAQYGGFGNSSDVNADIDAQRAKAKQQMSHYTKSQARTPRAAAARPGAPGAADRYGRIDMAGKPVSGYPVIRGDLNSMSVSRGGANGGRRRAAGRRAR
jgi:hypothetical protein